LSSSSGASSIHDWLRLTLAPEVGPVMARRLLDAFGDVASIFRAPIDQLIETPGIARARAAALRDPAVERAAEQEASLARKAGVRLVALDDPDYPELLKSLPLPAAGALDARALGA
jgi:DNA processing protein